MAKRNLFDELSQGFDALEQQRGGKLTLKTTVIDRPKPLQISARQIAAIRKRHNYSQAVFAAMLCTNVSTLRNWEQARSEPNAQAKVLLKLVDSEPGVLQALSTIALGTEAVKARSDSTVGKTEAGTKRKVLPRKKNKSESATRKAVA